MELKQAKQVLKSRRRTEDISEIKEIVAESVEVEDVLLRKNLRGCPAAGEPS